MIECPKRSVLIRYEHGRLGDAEAEPIEKHLGECGACRERMDRIRMDDIDARALRETLSESQSVSAGFDLSEPDNVFSGRAARGDDNSEGGDVFAARKELEAAHESPNERRLRERPESASGTGEWLVPDYERVRLCGEGSYGSVWAVRDRVGVYRALKVIDLARMSKAKVGCRESTALETYCRSLARHPSLITVFHVGVVGSTLYYTMELADDETTRRPAFAELPDNYRPFTLACVVARRRIQMDVAIEIARRLLQGLSKLHSLDLVHRDIKPANIVFVNRRPKLADIGMLTPTSESVGAVGTPRYMPPDKVMDKTADTFAMGKVLHEMIAGKSARTFPALPEEWQYGSDRWDMSKVSAVIEHACADSARDRYPSAAEMLEDLDLCADLTLGSLFEEIDEETAGSDPAADASMVNRQILLASIRAIPWVLGFLAFCWLVYRII